MTIVSIDFSILYPGVCICKDFNQFKWLAVVNSSIRKKDRANFEYLTQNYSNIKILYLDSKRSKADEYHITERIKLTNYFELITKLTDEIAKELKDEKEIIVVLEGISFGSSGNSLVDIAQATGILKREISRKLLNLNLEKFFIFSPSELKNAIGCKGNANKLDIFNKFKSDPIIESVKTSDLYKVVNSEEWVIEKDKILSPIIDMVDSFLGVVKIYQILK
jgi:Holliday junction resolvasome RuvABC endonuclease subunit